MERNPLLKKAEDTIGMIHDSLVTNQTIQKFPVDKFNKFFAPYFLGKLEMPEKSDIVDTWVGIAGSPFLPVDIVNNKNEILFQVPPIFGKLNSDANGKINFTDKFMELQQRSGDIPGRTQKFINNEIMPLTDGMKSEDYTSTWEGIGEVYGVEYKSSRKKEVVKSDIGDELGI